MNQSSQAQSQAQTQAQIAALREQNAILNQQLTSQAQSHIQHLQQLIPLHQPAQPAQATSTPPTPQPPVPQVPDPPTPVVPQTTQAGPTPSFNPDEMIQQMKHTVESSIQAFVDKNQDRNISQPPAPAHPPTPTYPQNISHSHHSGDYPKSIHRSPRRSRSHRHKSMSRRHDKRPVSIPRSPRRQRSTRRVRRSSRPRSSSREFLSPRHTSRQPSRATSITLRSASPQHREGRHRAQDHQPPRETTNPPATLQPASWDSPHTTPTLDHNPTTTTNRPQTSGNPGHNGKIIPSPPTHHIHQNGLTTPNHQLATMSLMTLPRNHSQHSPPTTPHLIARRKDHQAHQDRINPKLRPTSLQDT